MRLGVCLVITTLRGIERMRERRQRLCMKWKESSEKLRDASGSLFLCLAFSGENSLRFIALLGKSASGIFFPPLVPFFPFCRPCDADAVLFFSYILFPSSCPDMPFCLSPSRPHIEDRESTCHLNYHDYSAIFSPFTSCLVCPAPR